MSCSLLIKQTHACREVGLSRWLAKRLHEIQGGYNGPTIGLGVAGSVNRTVVNVSQNTSGGRAL